MATLTLRQCWINLVSTGTGIAAYVGPDRTRVHSVDGAVQVFAGGRTRAISAEGETSVVPLLLRAIPIASVETLRTWKGRQVEFRDQYGLQVYGTFFDVGITSYREGFHDVALNLQATAFTEGV